MKTVMGELGEIKKMTKETKKVVKNAGVKLPSSLVSTLKKVAVELGKKAEDNSTVNVLKNELADEKRRNKDLLAALKEYEPYYYGYVDIREEMDYMIGEAEQGLKNLKAMQADYLKVLSGATKKGKKK